MDLYFDIHVAGIWNLYRSSRLRVLQVILNCIAALGDRFSGPLNHAKQITIKDCQALADDICGTIPLVLGTKTSFDSHSQSTVEYPYSNNRKVTRDHRKTANAIGGWMLIEPHSQPLTTAMKTPYLRKGQREWLSQQLARVMKIYNIKAAGGHVGAINGYFEQKTP